MEDSIDLGVAKTVMSPRPMACGLVVLTCMASSAALAGGCGSAPVAVEPGSGGRTVATSTAGREATTPTVGTDATSSPAWQVAPAWDGLWNDPKDVHTGRLPGVPQSATPTEVALAIARDTKGPIEFWGPGDGSVKMGREGRRLLGTQDVTVAVAATSWTYDPAGGAGEGGRLRASGDLIVGLRGRDWSYASFLARRGGRGWLYRPIGNRDLIVSSAALHSHFGADVSLMHVGVLYVNDEDGVNWLVAVRGSERLGASPFGFYGDSHGYSIRGVAVAIGRVYPPPTSSENER